MTISRKIRQAVSKRATRRCEYCHLPDSFSFHPFQVDHVISVKHDGSDDVDNLAWACPNCNNAKGSDLGSYDKETGILTPFYNPRTQVWTDHFEISEGLIIGKTPEGRVTVHILLMNQSERVEVRKILIDAGLW